jgi:uncharacterized protein
MTYLSRLVDAELDLHLASSGAVLIEGPKGCGKTETARRASRSELLLDISPDARAIGEIDASLLLAGHRPRLLDEWQIVPALWNQVRRAVDARRASGQFILTGSAVPADDVTRHTGAGRISRLRMRPMSFLERGLSTGGVSLRALLDGTAPSSGDPGLSVRDLAHAIVVGGWPLNLGASAPDAMRSLRSYLEDVQRADIQRVDGVDRDPQRVGRVLRAYARHIGTEAALSTITADVDGSDGSVHRDTLASYLTALERLLIVEEQPAWAPHLRSRARLRSASKRHFVDPSLAAAALRAGPERLLTDPTLLGTLFESLVVRDLRVYAQTMDAQVLHYRDNTDLEIDTIVETTDGRWAAFEVKLGTASIDLAAENLKRFAAKIDVDRSGRPASLGVITGTGYGYRRPDGIDVIPIGALGA